MTISMHQLSVGTFTQFMDSLSDLLDHAAAHAERRKIDPSILLSTRLYPNMYDLTRQVGEAIRHAVLSCALLAGVDRPVFKEVTFTFRNGATRTFTGQSLLLTFSVPQFFFHVTTAYDILRHCGVELVKKDFLGKQGR